MTLAQSLLPEFDHEMATTRRLLERVPAEHASWRPHPKSTALGALAVHLATLAGMGRRALELTELDFNPPGAPPFRPAAFESTAQVVALFDANVLASRAAIERASDTDLATSWTLKSGGRVVFTLPRTAVLRSMMINHIIHHRGQLSVYLRLNDVPVPSIYGPTADESP